MTKQRTLILDIIKNSHAHLTCEQIYDIVRNMNHNMVYATVYNSVNYLVEKGLIRRIRLSTDADHYDGNLIPHDHFICKVCKHVIDMPSTNKEVEPLMLEGHKVESMETVYIGICKHCLN